MKYISFTILNYRAIEGPLEIDFSKNSIVPLVGLNECGKTTILQAIYAFDYMNDNEYQSKHLKDTKNLYQTKEKDPPLVNAKIEIKSSELMEFINIQIDKYNSTLEESLEELDENEEDYSIKAEEITSKRIKKVKIDKSNFIGYITISRDLTSKSYWIENLNEIPERLNGEIAESIVRKMPYILYNDDFMDRPPNSIEVPLAKPATLTGWLSIFERLFISTSSDYSLFKIIKEEDTRRRDAILSDVQEKLNSTLSKAWKNFSLSGANHISIKLSIEAGPNNSKSLNIQIVEKINSKERFFDVIDRSKGFLWFFNFVMKLEFNPKVIVHNENSTIYLLDEPGSYLHYSAQAKLCEKIVDISKKHGIVIFCTHSHTLLNPEIIPLNCIYIVEKDRLKRISAKPIGQIQTKYDSNNAFQPIHEALQISAFEHGSNKESIVAVEGIFDKYAIELMLDLNDIAILPGTSANSIIRNIQFLNGYNKNYMALWDNDEEGQKQYKSAIAYFGEHEAQKFDLLPKLEKPKRRMENMFEESDLAMIANKLELEAGANYEKIISTLYYSKKKIREQIVNSVGPETTKRFNILRSIIEKKIKLAKELGKLRSS